MSDINVLGAGGHAKVVIQACRAAGLNPKAIFDDSEDLMGQCVLGVPVRGTIRTALEIPKPSVIAIGNNRVRRKLFETLELPWATIVHPHAVIDSTVEIGEGTVVFAGAIVQVDSKIGHNAIINTGVTIDHDCRVDNHSHVGPGCHFSGNVSIGMGTLIGVGTSVRPGVSIGDWVTVGAGSTVVSDLPPRSVCYGNPAVPR